MDNGSVVVVWDREDYSKEAYKQRSKISFINESFVMIKVLLLSLVWL